MARGEWSDGRRDMFVSPIYQPPRGVIRDLLGLAHLSGQGPLPRPLHGEAEGSGVPPPGRVLLSQMPGNAGYYSMDIKSDLEF